MLRLVDAAQALADLTEISSQVVDVVIVGGETDRLLASTIADEPRAQHFLDGVRKLLTEADRVRQSRGLADLSQLEVATLGGSVFVVHQADARRLIAATTRPDPTVGLVFYDLKHCLRSIDEPPPEVGDSSRRSLDASVNAPA
jgi:hypothetical protein